MTLTPSRRIGLIALAVLVTDQLTKWAVRKHLYHVYYVEEKVIIPGFFKLVYWHNTGAAWSLFSGNNEILAVIALLALLVLFLSRHHFNSKTVLGQFAFGFIFGGIAGNLIDRLRFGHVVDFLYFYLKSRGGGEPWSFPAFNVADSAICVGVGLIFLMSWRSEKQPDKGAPAKTVEPSTSG